MMKFEMKKFRNGTPGRLAAAIVLVASLVLAASCSKPAAPDIGRHSSRLLVPGADIGMWVWHREEVIDPLERARLIEFCQTFGINRLLVQVRFEPAGDGYRLATPGAWQALIGEAAQAGIAVEALDGGNAMGFAANRANTLARLEAVLEFHRGQPASGRFAGIHYDIEPYTSERWRSGDVEAVMLEFLETAALLRQAVKEADPDLPLAHDIPFWYAGKEQYLLEFDGARKNFHEHIQDLSDYIGIMSYRTHITGPNSVTAITEPELAYGRRIGRPVYLALETVRLDETPTITFHGRSSEEYVAAIRELHAHHAGDPAFGGILLHQYRTMRPLLDGFAGE